LEQAKSLEAAKNLHSRSMRPWTAPTTEMTPSVTRHISQYWKFLLILVLVGRQLVPSPLGLFRGAHP